MSTRFYLWMKQCGEGCDYTIGCGEKLVELKGATRETLAARVEQEIEDHGGDISKTLVLTNLQNLDKLHLRKGQFMLDAEKKKEERKRQAAEEAEDLQAKREQLRKLKEELGE